MKVRTRICQLVGGEGGLGAGSPAGGVEAGVRGPPVAADGLAAQHRPPQKARRPTHLRATDAPAARDQLDDCSGQLRCMRDLWMMMMMVVVAVAVMAGNAGDDYCGR